METDPDSIPVRLPRYVRNRYQKPPLLIQPRDEEIIELVSRHRFITSDDLQLLVSGSKQNILRRLQRLFHHSYLDRPRIQRISGNSRMVYALGQRGAELIALRTGRKLAGDWVEKNRQVRERYLEHSLMVSRLQTALSYACSQNGTVLLEQWFGDGVIRDSVPVESGHAIQRIPIRPDALFVLNVLGGAKPGRIHCLLEADRGTMTVQRFITKLRGYFQYWRSGSAEQHFGVRNFLVVTITASEERAVNLAKAARSISDRGLRMFLFCPELGYLPAVRLAVLATIFRSPDGGEHSLLE